MQVIGVAGLPGSGKSRLMDELERQGYRRFNDINRDWAGNLPSARAEARAGRRIAVADIKFCDATWRHRLEDELGLPVQWIFFANDPWQCAKNCLFRVMFEKPYRPLQREIERIQALSPQYHPHGDVRPVFRIDEQQAHGAHLTPCQQL